MTKALILTASFGEGHNAAARGLQEAFQAQGIQSRIADLFPTAFGERYTRSRHQYLQLVNHQPWLWSAFYRLLDLLPLERLLRPLLLPLQNAFTQLIEEFQPHLVVSVYPVYAPFMEALRTPSTRSAPALFTVVTDSITVNAIWHRSSRHSLLLPNEDTRQILLQRGLPASQLHVTGFPVSPRFTAPAPARPDPGPNHPPKLLLMVNGRPDRAINLIADLLAQSPFQLTVTVGRDEVLAAKIRTLFSSHPSRGNVLGWVDNVPELLRSHHVLIGKAGGATVQETLAAKTPMLMTQIFPGQEEGNAKLLLQHQCGAFCPNNASVLKTLHLWFEADARLWKTLRQNTEALAQPDAAARQVAWMLSHLN
jgi:processive 1,2-diacylglycerol beta-glucosyltransferase